MINSLDQRWTVSLWCILRVLSLVNVGLHEISPSPWMLNWFPLAFVKVVSRRFPCLRELVVMISLSSRCVTFWSICWILGLVDVVFLDIPVLVRI